VVDIPTRPGITQRMLVLQPAQPRAAVILLAGGHGGLQIFPNGSMHWGSGNFLVRTRSLFAEQGLLVAVVDAPSDRQRSPFLSGHRQTADHVADLRATIAWVRQQAPVPVWLVGTSRGTQSAAYVASELPLPDGPDGVVLTSTIMTDLRGRAVPAMDLARIQVPVLVLHHEQDGCRLCEASWVPELVRRLRSSPRAEGIVVTGGSSQGDPCEAFAHHGFNGIEPAVVQRIAAWIAGR
jgi:pimeloyl-ACP methyl ester carboxylesterase